MTAPNSSYPQIDLDMLERRIFDYDHPKKPSGWSDADKHALIDELRAARKVVEAAREFRRYLSAPPRRGESPGIEYASRADELDAALAELEHNGG